MCHTRLIRLQMLSCTPKENDLLLQKCSTQSPESKFFFGQTLHARPEVMPGARNIGLQDYETKVKTETRNKTPFNKEKFKIQGLELIIPQLDA